MSGEQHVETIWWGWGQRTKLCCPVIHIQLENWGTGGRREEECGKKKGGMVFGTRGIKKWWTTSLWPAPYGESQASSHVLEKNMKLMQMILPLTISTKKNRILIRKKISIQVPIPNHVGAYGPSENSMLSTFRSKKYPHGDLVFLTII